MTNKIKLKEVVPYLLLVVLSFFVGSFISKIFLGTGLEIRSFSSLIPATIIAVIIYSIYIVTHLILKKVLPVHIYKDNKITKFLVFFLVYVIGWIISPIVVLFLVVSFSSGNINF